MVQQPCVGNSVIWDGILHPSREKEYYVVTLLEPRPEFRGWIVDTEEGMKVFAFNEDLMIPEEE